jgi:hypothetical protein
VFVPALGAVAVLALTGCDPDQVASGDGGSSGSSNGGGRSATGFGVGPLDNPDGTKPGLAPLTSDTDRAAARKVIEKVATKGRGPRTGYERDEFGYAWKDSVDGVPLARNGCDTRNDLLKLHGRHVRFRTGSDCVVVSMDLHDPYTGKDIAWKKAKATVVQIDHMVPLSYAWQMGPVDGPANNAKRDSGPASWLPPSKAIRCSYAVRFAQVALKYELAVTAPDKSAMLRQCGG